MIGIAEEILFLEAEIDRLEIEIMPLRLKQHGYQVLLDRKRQDQGLRKLFELCGVYEGSRVLVTPNGEAEALYEVSGVLYSTTSKSIRVKGIRLLKSGHRPKYCYEHSDLGSIEWFAKNHKRKRQ
jgi:hypothetical protein